MKVSDFKTEEQLKEMKVPEIKAHVREFNEHYKISGYSKLRKDQLISEILTAQMRVRNAGKEAPKPAPKVMPKKTDPKKREKREMELKQMKKAELVEMVLPSDKKKTKQEIINLILKEQGL